MRPVRSNVSGSVAVEFALVGTTMIMIVVALTEAMLGFWQWNTAMRAARTGARLAAVSTPVASDLLSADLGTSGTVAAAYTRICDGASRTCTNGTYDSGAMARLIFGADGICAGETQLQRRGICDVYGPVREANVRVTYSSSLNEISGSPAGLQPVITVRLQGLDLDYAILPLFGPLFDQLPATAASTIGQDLSNG